MHTAEQEASKILATCTLVDRVITQKQTVLDAFNQHDLTPFFNALAFLCEYIDELAQHKEELMECDTIHHLEEITHAAGEVC